jgi:hypothetical protein
VFYRQSGYGLSARSDDGGTDAALLTGTGVRLMVQDADGISSSVFAVRRDPEQQRLEATAESINEVVGNATGSIRVTKLNDTTTNNVRIDLDAAVPLSVFRFWSAQYSSHFYTIDPTEFAYVRDSYADSEWTYEGVAYRAFSTQRPGTVPLYRFWSQTQRGHFYTTEVGEKDFIVATYPTDVWNFEGTAFYVYPDTTAVTPTQRVWRFWSPSARHHFFTASDSEKDFVVATYPPSQWTFEGAAFRVPTN